MCQLVTNFGSELHFLDARVSVAPASRRLLSLP